MLVMKNRDVVRAMKFAGIDFKARHGTGVMPEADGKWHQACAPGTAVACERGWHAATVEGASRWIGPTAAIVEIRSLGRLEDVGRGGPDKIVGAEMRVVRRFRFCQSLSDFSKFCATRAAAHAADAADAAYAARADAAALSKRWSAYRAHFKEKDVEWFEVRSAMSATPAVSATPAIPL